MTVDGGRNSAGVGASCPKIGELGENSTSIAAIGKTELKIRL
jgi:hypothetical protein